MTTQKEQDEKRFKRIWKKIDAFPLPHHKRIGKACFEAGLKQGREEKTFHYQKGEAHGKAVMNGEWNSKVAEFQKKLESELSFCETEYGNQSDSVGILEKLLCNYRSIFGPEEAKGKTQVGCPKISVSDFARKGCESERREQPNPRYQPDPQGGKELMAEPWGKDDQGHDWVRITKKEEGEK